MIPRASASLTPGTTAPVPCSGSPGTSGGASSRAPRTGSSTRPGKQSAGAATGVKSQDGDGNECGRRGVDSGAWLIRCTALRAHGATSNPKGRYLAGFDPYVVDPTGEWQRRSSWSATGMRRSGSSAAGKPKPATTRHPPTPCSARAALRTGLPVYRVAVEYEPSRLAPVAENPEHQSLLGQLYLDGPSPAMPPPRRRGTVPSRRAGRRSRAPRATSVQPGPPKSVIYRYSPWRRGPGSFRGNTEGSGG